MFVEDIKYCVDLFERKRLPTREVVVGNIQMGGENPICIQSMTTTDTMNTDLSVAQSIRMITAGCEIVRLTAPSKKEAENLREIKKLLREAGYSAPLVADIHFTPNAAEIAATIVEKVRVNPGNYADKKKFEEINYTDHTYNDELLRIEEKFTPLVLLCKKHGTAMRIGTNHGSLSDRILSRYGDTPQGMVESAMEFIRICEKNNFNQLVVSMKASNTLVMVQAYRLLCSEMIKNNRYYPLHLGVTEAGDGEDGRIKSAVGIGALLADGIGDTIRVSLTEEPEHEIPVAQKLVDYYSQSSTSINTPFNKLPYSPFEYNRRESKTVHNIGGKNVPVAIADFSKKGKEAVYLVLKSVLVGKCGETLILDMGEPVKIVDVAKKMIADSGKSIRISFTGLRTGEKLNEVIIGENEKFYYGDNKYIRHTRVPPIDKNAL